MTLDMRALVAKLDGAARKGLEAAAQLCVSRTHFNVEVEHFLVSLLEQDGDEVSAVLRYYKVSVPQMVAELRAALDRLPRGNSRTPAMTPLIREMLEAAWLYSSIDLDSKQIRPSAVLLAMLEQDSLRGLTAESCPALLRITRQQLRDDLPELVRAVDRDRKVAAKAEVMEAAARPLPVAPRKQMAPRRNSRNRHRRPSPGTARPRPWNASPSTSRRRPAPAAWTPSTAATTKCARWPTS